MNAERTGVTESLFTGVNEPADPNNLSELEKKHLPVIDAPERVPPGECFEVTVEVGRLHPHPNEHKHFIQFVDLYAGGTYLARADLTSAKVDPKVTFRITLTAPVEELRACAHCNMHGTWLGRTPLSVVTP